jgi:hypothetical protein
MEGRLALEWATTRMVSDDPAKGLGLAVPEALLLQGLKEIIGEPAAEVALVSAYFVPAAAGTDAFDSSIPTNAYEVRLSDTGELFWIERRGEQLVRHDTEPGTSFWQRAGVWFLSLFPIEWLS